VGGILRTFDLLTHARRAGWKAIVGAHVGESSLLTRVGFTAAQAAGDDLLLAQEGAFGTHLLARDVVETPLMFGARGRLDVAASQIHADSGCGLRILPDLPIHPLTVG
jgi:hypothetical protein